MLHLSRIALKKQIKELIAKEEDYRLSMIIDMRQILNSQQRLKMKQLVAEKRKNKKYGLANDDTQKNPGLAMLLGRIQQELGLSIEQVSKLEAILEDIPPLE